MTTQNSDPNASMNTAKPGTSDAASKSNMPDASGYNAAKGADATVETKYWKDNYASRPYANGSDGYDEFAPAYRYGWESFGHRSNKPGVTFESIEADLGRGWDKAKGTSKLGWDKAKVATQEAWNRVAKAGHDLVDTQHTPAGSANQSKSR